MLRRISTLLICLCAASSALPASAQERASADLRYTRDTAARRCPERAAIMSAVAVRLGYVPWRPDAERIVEVTMRRRGRGLEARMLLRDRAGKVKGQRRIRSASRDCKELAAAMELAISIAIDPLSLGRSAPASRPTPPAPDSAPAPTPTSAPSSRPAAVERAPHDPAVRQAIAQFHGRGFGVVCYQLAWKLWVD